MIRTILIIAICLTTTLAVPAWEGKRYTIGVENLDYDPYYNGKEGEYSGFARELLDAFAERHGYEFEYVPRPVRRLYQEFVTTQELDFKFPDNSSWMSDLKEEHNVLYSQPVCAYVDGILVKANNLGKGLEHLKILGVIHGFGPLTHLKGFDPQTVELSFNSNIRSMVKMAMAGRVDGFYANVAVAKLHLAEMGIEQGLIFDPSLPHSDGDYYMSTINHPEVLKQFNMFLQKEAKFVRHLKRKYGIDVPHPLHSTNLKE